MADIIPIDSRRTPLHRRSVTLQLVGRVAEDTGMMPFLGSTSDGKDYWCKRVNSNHEREAVVNEVAASIIGQRINANVREWKIVTVPDWMQGHPVGTGHNRYRLDGRPLFGSLDLHTAVVKRPENVVPHVSDDSNDSHVPKLIALWLLCNVEEDFQVLVDQANQNTLWSIDHGFWFDSWGPPWKFSELDSPGGKHPLPRVREAISPHHWANAIDSLDTLDSTLQDEIYSLIPPEWQVKESEIEKLSRYVLSRVDYTKSELRRLQETERRR